MRVARCALAIAILGVALTAAALAQVQRSGGSAASAALMQQYQQAVTERAQLQADNEKMKKELEDLKKQLDSSRKELSQLKAGSSRSQAALAAVQASKESSDKALADSKSKMQELIGRFRDTLTTLRAMETERTQAQQQLSQSKTAYDQCALRNDALYQVDNEVLDRYQHQGAFSYLERAEPFTRLKRTQIDNLALEYRQRAAELRVKKAAPGAPGSSGATPAPASGPQGSPATPDSSATQGSPAATSKPDETAQPGDAPRGKP